MVKYEDECVGCPPNMGCLHSACPYMHIPVLYCDDCRSEVECLYIGNDEGEYCKECILDHLDKIEP